MQKNKRKKTKNFIMTFDQYYEWKFEFKKKKNETEDVCTAEKLT